MVLSLDVAPEVIEEHDDWHTHEHLPERLSIPGFLRGSRWTALSGGPRYFILYEVADVGVLTSAAYLDRLNNPTPWTSKIMKSYRGMSRGLCRVERSFGAGIGQVALVVRFAPATAKQAPLRDWLTREALPALPSQRGLTSAHLLESAAKPEMTTEQQIRGRDAAVDWVVLVSGYSADRVRSLAENALHPSCFERHGAMGPVASGTYRLDCSLTDGEMG